MLLVCPQLAEALQVSAQAQAELSLQQKLREDSEQRLEEMEESLLEKEQELQRRHALIGRLQGEVLAPQGINITPQLSLLLIIRLKKTHIRVWFII